MKKALLIGLFSCGLAFGQYFESSDEIDQPEQTEFFSATEDADIGSYTGNPPDYGEDAGPGNPGGKRPIDDWWWILPLAGMLLGYRLIRNKNKESIQH